MIYQDMRSPGGSILNYIASLPAIFDYSFRAINLFSVIGRLWESTNSNELTETQKTHRVATDAILAVALVTEFGADLAGLPAHTRGMVKVGLGVADVSSEISQKFCKNGPLDLEDGLDVFTRIALRTANAGAVLAEPGACLEDRRNELENLSHVANILANRKVIQSAAGVIMRRFFPEEPGPVAPNEPESVVANRPEAPAPNCHIQAIANPRDIEVQRAKRVIYEIFREALDAPSLLDLRHIPDCFSTDSVLEKRQCPISGWPIRFVLLVEETKHDQIPVYYEKQAIQKWLRDHPMERPKGWPEQISFSRDGLKTAPAIQNEIDNRLNKLLVGIRKQIQ